MPSGRFRAAGVLPTISLLAISLTLAACLGGSAIRTSAVQTPAILEQESTGEFRIQDCDFSPEGRNPYFILVPGYEQVFEGRVGGKRARKTVTVTEQTRQVDGVETRVVVEQETHDGEPYEVSRNYFAICKQTNSVFYFGEHVDFYENGQIVSHEGSWEAGVDNARAGLIMPGIVLLGSRYFQEVAPDIALDRAEIVSMDETISTWAGTFKQVVKMAETSALERDRIEYKYYAAGVGMVQDEWLELVRYGRSGTGGGPH